MDREFASRAVDEALARALPAAGTTLHAWRLRSIHRRGDTATSVLVEADVTDVARRDRTLLYVLHTSTRAVPTGPSTVEVDGAAVHVWRFPDDPYLPGLRPAVSRRRAGALLRAHDLGGRDDAGVHTRSYRPTRRAVVALTPAGARDPALYLKVLGGRTSGRVRRRATSLVAAHDHLAATLPVPRVVTHDLDLGTVALERLPGDTLRHRLRTGRALPDPEELAELACRIADTPPLPSGRAPARFADVARHVALLERIVPSAADLLVRIAAAVDDIGGPTGTLHGDLHDGQVLVDDRHGRTDVVGLLDVDGIGTGPLAHDAGRLVANIEVAALSATGQVDAVEDYAARVAARLCRTIPMAELARGAAGAWLGLATGPHRVRHEGWRDATTARLDRAATWLEAC